MIDLRWLMPYSASDPPAYATVTPETSGYWLNEGRALLEQAMSVLHVRQWRADSVARRLVKWLSEEAAAVSRGLTGLLANGTASLTSWFRGMLSNLVPAHFAAALATLGPPDARPELDVRFMSDQVNRQAGFLDRFRRDLASAEAVLGPRSVARAALYGHGVWGVAQNARRHAAIASGRFSEELRVLGVADHCPDCVSQSGMRWQPLGTLLPIGATVCMSLCHCWFQFR